MGLESAIHEVRSWITAYPKVAALVAAALQ